jgi:hypothetical protein
MIPREAALFREDCDAGKYSSALKYRVDSSETFSALVKGRPIVH